MKEAAKSDELSLCGGHAKHPDSGGGYFVAGVALEHVDSLRPDRVDAVPSHWPLASRAMGIEGSARRHDVLPENAPPLWGA
jgi:hypothetical protein